MNNLPQQILCRLIEQYGTGLCYEPKRCEGMLRDLCGEHRREISALVGALNQDVVADLLKLQGTGVSGLSMGPLSQRLQDNLALAPMAAVWAVESWALALGLIQTTSGTVSAPNNSSPVSYSPSSLSLSSPPSPSVPQSSSVDDNGINNSEVIQYLLTLTFTSLGNKRWNYAIDLIPRYEDHPNLFFTDRDGWEKQKFEVALEAELGRQPNRVEVDGIIQKWCKQIALGYREALLDF